MTTMDKGELRKIKRQFQDVERCKNRVKQVVPDINALCDEPVPESVEDKRSQLDRAKKVFDEFGEYSGAFLDEFGKYSSVLDSLPDDVYEDQIQGYHEMADFKLDLIKFPSELKVRISRLRDDIRRIDGTEFLERTLSTGSLNQPTKPPLPDDTGSRRSFSRKSLPDDHMFQPGVFRQSPVDNKGANIKPATDAADQEDRSYQEGPYSAGVADAWTRYSEGTGGHQEFRPRFIDPNVRMDPGGGYGTDAGQAFHTHIGNGSGSNEPPGAIANPMNEFVNLLASALNNHRPSPAGHVRLPMIELPKFSGRYADWQSFWDKFERAVDQNPGISGADKLTYLVTRLADEPAKLVKHLPATNENYQAAVRTLKASFGNPVAAMENIQSRIYDLKHVNRNDFGALKEFYYEVENLLGCLYALGRAQGSDHLVGLLLKKLPLGVVISIERSKGSKREWTMDLLREALKEELDIQEAARRRASGGGQEWFQSNNKKNTSFRNLTTTDAFYSDDGQPKSDGSARKGAAKTKKKTQTRRDPVCVYCESDHYSNECEKHPTMKERKRLLVEQKRCFKCLTMKHKLGDCTSYKRCFFCKENSHHSSICPAEFGGQKDEGKKFDDKKRANGNYKDRRDSEESKLADDESTIMKTAMITVQNPDDPTKTMKIRAFLDTGTSRSFLTERMAKRLNLKTDTNRTLRIKRYGADDEPPMLDKVKTAFLDLKTNNSDTIRIKVAVSSNSMKSMTKCPIPASMLKNLPKGVELADEALPAFTEVDVDFMIGNDHYEDLLTGNRTSIGRGLWLVESVFGWIPSGRVPHDAIDVNQPLDVTAFEVLAEPVSASDELAMVERECIGDIEDLWRLESIGINDSVKDQTDDFATESFNRTVRFADGRYEVTWPWKSNKEELPTNYGVAIRRLRSMLGRQRAKGGWDFLDRYDKIIRDQIDKGVIELIDDRAPTMNTIHYLAHHGVETPHKTTKLRVVYDASARESPDKPCLNDCVYRGPIILENLATLLIRFRCHPIALIADIEKAFLQVGLQEHERDATRFLWVRDPKKPPNPDNLEVYRFRRVSFGIKASPFLLGATLMHHLKHEGTGVAQKIANNLYVDNVIMGVDSESEAWDFYKKSKEIFKRAGMNLREYGSNSMAFVSKLPDQDRIKDRNVKVLGINWSPQTDDLSIKVSVDESNPASGITKKYILSQLFKIFDPLGFGAPVTIRGKILLQKITKAKFDWSAILPAEYAKKWCDLKSNLLEINSVTVPRFVGAKLNETSRLMAFCDASKQAYAAVVYLQTYTDGHYESKLVMAKARVNPVKELSIPRLELTAMLIAVRLVEFVRKSLSFTGRAYIWSDSKCVLYWIKSDKVQTQFVANRLNEIKQIKNAEFRYVPTKENPADRASRGVPTKELDETWWNGPPWASKDENQWPVQDEALKEDRPDSHHDEVFAVKEVRHALLNETSPYCIEMTNFSKLSRVIRVTAWCTRFIDAARKKKRDDPVLSPNEIRASMNLWVKHVQKTSFAELICALKRRRPHSLMKSLGTRLDTEGIIRCHGRLANIDADEGTKYPILLPSKSHLTDLILAEYHERNFHAGIGQTIACVRHQYWVPKIRSRVRTVISKCPVCRKYEGGPFERPQMPDLPRVRVTRSRPFQHVGLDYFGPLYVKSGHVAKKRWICLFTCLAVRAIHLEVVNDQSAEEFMLAFQRFIALRGKPVSVLCDNATQFKAVKSADPFSAFLSGRQIQWEFIPQLAPWAGGVYERLIKIIKSSLIKTIGRQLLTQQRLVTVITEVQLAVNSRPLTYIEDDVDNAVPLTPNDFLGLDCPQGIILDRPEDPTYDPKKGTKEALREAFRRNARVTEQFWKVWSNEYLLSLRERTTWRHKDPKKRVGAAPEKGEVVLVKESLLPRQKWVMGKISDVIRGKDGGIRAAKVTLPSRKTLVRPVNLLFPLECSPKAVDSCGNEGGGDGPKNAIEEKVRPKRQTALAAARNIKAILQDENDIE